MSNRSDSNEEIMRKAERDRDLLNSGHSLSKKQVTNIVCFC